MSYPSSTAGPGRLIHGRPYAVILTIAALLAASSIAGCVNSQLATARSQLAAGDLSAAHQSLLAASRSPNLSLRDQREVDDGLCLTEYRIGAPTYSIARQRLTCGAAARLAGSHSGAIVATLDRRERDATAAEVASALKAHDLTRADQAIIEYQRYPGADSGAVAQWSRELRRTADRQFATVSRRRRRRLTPAIATMERRYPEMRKMNDAAFSQWVMRHTTVDGAPLVSAVSVARDHMHLTVADNRLADVRFNLNRFTRINDAMVARCRCDGHTAIDLAGSGLPAFLLRLDPETRQSEVLVMPQPQ